ncbi:MAG: PhoH family protein, partial [Tepidisphaeraceae bacterium]
MQVVSRDDELKVSGEKDQVSKAIAVLEQMQKKLRRQDWLSTEDVGQAIGRAAEQTRDRSADDIDVYAKGPGIKPKTDGQKRYMEAVMQNDLTFCIGPAGTGKTYLAVA